MTEMQSGAGAPEPQDPAAPARPNAAGGIGVFTSGGIYPQFTVLLFVNIAMLFGAILPWHGGPDATTGLFTYPGALVGFFAFAGAWASLSSIYSGRLVIWPTLLTWLIADCFLVAKILSIFRDEETSGVLGKVFSSDFKEGLTDLGNIVGVGFTFILVSAVFLLVFLVVSVFSGAKAQAKKKEAQKQARQAGRGRSR